MREIVHIQAGQCGNQIGAKVSFPICIFHSFSIQSTVAKMASFLHDFAVHVAKICIEAGIFTLTHLHLCIPSCVRVCVEWSFWVPASVFVYTAYLSDFAKMLKNCCSTLAFGVQNLERKFVTPEFPIDIML